MTSPAAILLMTVEGSCVIVGIFLLGMSDFGLLLRFFLLTLLLL